MSDILYPCQQKAMTHDKATPTEAERQELKGIMNKGKHGSHQFRNACILLNCDAIKKSRLPF